MSNSINAKFVGDITRFVLKSKAAHQACTKEILKKVGLRLVDLSPVGDPSKWQEKPHKGYIPGHFINNWQMGVDIIPTGIIGAVDPSGAASIARMHKAVPRWPVGHIYYFTNNLPYARLLETGLHSSQCPGGMVGLTVREYPQIVREAELNYSKKE